MVPRSRAHINALALATLLWACGSPTDSDTGPTTRYRIPEQTGDGWTTASATSVGMVTEPLEGLLTRIGTTANHQIHGLLIVRQGRLVFEAYWPGSDLAPGTRNPVERNFDRDTRHYVASVSKSITSMLAGIAIADGAIGSVDAPLFSFFPDYAELEDDAKAGVTLRTLLSFSSGLYWNEFEYGFDHPSDSHYQMFAAQDPIRYLLERDMVGQPGGAFLYNSGDTNLVGEIVRRATGSETFLDFLDERLFGPLGISDYQWSVFGQAPQITFASGGAYMKPRDMAKLGQLYLDGGSWQGTQIVPASWVDASVALSTPLEGPTHYGYGFNWWLGRSGYGGGGVDFFHALGWGGQDVFVYPALDLVVVFTRGGFYNAMPLNAHDLLEDYILAAVTTP